LQYKSKKLVLSCGLKCIFFQDKSFHSNTLNEVSGLSLLSDSDCEALTDDVINYDPDFDLCAGRKEIIRLHTEPVFKVQSNLS